jgi:hypothetical protein
MPRPVVRPNDPAPWVAALRELLTDGPAYRRESQASRTAAQRFVGRLDAADMERYLTSLAVASDVRPDRGHGHATIESLSPEKRALLLERLRKRKGVK